MSVTKGTEDREPAGAPAAATGESRVADALRAAAEGVTAATGAAFFRGLAQHLAQGLRAAYALVGRRTGPGGEHLRTLAFVDHGRLAPEFSFALRGTPCADVLEGRLCSHPAGVARTFPEDAMLAAMGVQSYVGMPLCDSKGETLGLIAVMDERPMEDPDLAADTLRIFAARAAGELERIAAEEALRASESLYRALAESSPLGIWHVTLEGRTIYANPVMCDLLELGGPEALVDRTHHEFFTAEGLALMAREQGKRRLGQRSSYEVDLRGARGAQRRVVVSGGPVFGPGGTLASVIGTFVDVTEMRRHDEERLRLASRLEAAQRLESLGVLAGGIAHDFNNLLTGVLGNASLARTQLPDASPVRPLLERIERSAQRAAELTDQMLAYAGKGRFRLEPVSLPDLLSDMGALLRSSVSRKSTLTIESGAEVPSVEGDAAQLRQVVLNLVQNASDALEERAGEVRVATGRCEADAAYLSACATPEVREPGTYAYVEVADDGAGMSPSTLERIFEPFFTTKSTGRGLGLAAVLGIVRGHRGAIHVQSRPGAGTTFRVLFPAAGAITRRAPRGPRRSGAPGAPTILVVDDEDAVRDVTVMTLELAGFRVVAAGDGAAGVEAVRTLGEALGAVLLDMMMPVMGGDEALREMRRLRPDLPVVLMSGYTEHEATRTLGEHRPDGFLKKPFRAHEVLDRVRELLGP